METEESYQPLRVLMSVLLMAAAESLTSTSPTRGSGTGRSVRYSSLSSPPCPVSNTPAIVFGIKEGMSRQRTKKNERGLRG